MANLGFFHTKCRR